MKEITKKEIYLNENTMIKIGENIRKRSVDCYLLFALVINTGLTTITFRNMTVQEMDEFMDQYDLPLYLCVQLRSHMYGKDSNSPFFRAKQKKDAQLNYRSYEDALKRAGQKVGIPSLALRMTEHVFYFNYFRDNGYSYDAVKKILRARRRPVPSYEAFLTSYGISRADVEQDYKQHKQNLKTRLGKQIDLIRYCLNQIELDLEDCDEIDAESKIYMDAKDPLRHALYYLSLICV